MTLPYPDGAVVPKHAHSAAPKCIDRDGNEDPDRRKDPPTREWSAKEAERLIRLRNTFETRYYRAL